MVRLLAFALLKRLLTWALALIGPAPIMDYAHFHYCTKLSKAEGRQALKFQASAGIKHP